MNPPSAAALAPLPEKTPVWWPLLRWLLVAACVLPLLLFAAPTLLHLPRYDVSGGQIVARSVMSVTVIPAGTTVQKAPLYLRRKIYGSDAPGYLVGRFDSNRGEVAVYGDGSGTGLLFATQPPTYLTPADPDALLSAWKRGDTASFRPATSTQAGWGSIAFLLLLSPALAVAWFLLARPPRLSYEISGDALTVKTRASTTIFPRYATKASLTNDALGVRLFGTGMPGYYTGTFSTRSGNVQAAASSARPGQALLLVYGDKKYYLTPTDPAAVAQWFAGSQAPT